MKDLGLLLNKDKVGALLKYLSIHIESLNMMKLLKLVFIIDESFIQEEGIPVTWLNYYAWEKGPVTPVIYDIKNENIFCEYVQVRRNEQNQVLISPVNYTEDLSLFSDYEVAFIDKIIKEYGHCTGEQLSAKTHEEETIWTNAVQENNIDFKELQGKSNLLLDLSLSINDQLLSEKYQDALEYMNFRSLMES